MWAACSALFQKRQGFEEAFQRTDRHAGRNARCVGCHVRHKTGKLSFGVTPQPSWIRQPLVVEGGCQLRSAGLGVSLSQEIGETRRRSKARSGFEMAERRRHFATRQSDFTKASLSSNFEHRQTWRRIESA